MLLRMQRKGNPHTLLVRMYIGAVTVDNTVEKRTKSRTTTGSSNSTLGYILKKIQDTNWERHMHPNVHSSIIYTCQGMEAI